MELLDRWKVEELKDKYVVALHEINHLRMEKKEMKHEVEALKMDNLSLREKIGELEQRAEALSVQNSLVLEPAYSFMQSSQEERSELEAKLIAEREAVKRWKREHRNNTPAYEHKSGMDLCHPKAHHMMCS